MDLDLSPVVPEAREAVKEASQVWLSHLDPWFVGLMIHGSALKGGFIPHGSDIDFHLYMADEVLEADGQLPIDLALAIHRDLAAIDISPFQYIQCYPRPPRLTQDEIGRTGPIPGTYHMLAGRLPVPEATAEQVVSRARQKLEQLNPVPFGLANNLMSHGTGQLERNVRLICTDVWPTLKSLLSLREADPLAPWQLSKGDAIALLDGEPAGEAARLFYRRAVAYYTEGQSVEDALAVLDAAVRFLRAAREWWDHYASYVPGGPRRRADE